MFRPSKAEEDAEVECINGNVSNTKIFLFVYQSKWQKNLLNKYGNEIVMIDATYKTTKYSLPLFFICTKTNVDYIVVGSFICQHEDSNSIAEALQIFYSWNKNWNPLFWMVDYSEAEMNALRAVFPTSAIYICDFHREQAWERWTNCQKNCSATEKESILEAIRKVADSANTEQYDANIKELKKSQIYENRKFQLWFERTWLNNHEKWVVAFRRNRYNVAVNTNNGLERQNKTFKHDYLKRYRDSSISESIEVEDLVISYQIVSDASACYVERNTRFSNLYRQYNKSLPPYLMDRPREMVKHILKREESAVNIRKDLIVQKSNVQFSVPSEETEKFYLVSFGDGNEMPFCECEDWCRTRWLCKHFCAVFNRFPEYDWYSLSPLYINLPYFKLDTDSSGIDLTQTPCETHCETQFFTENDNTQDLEEKSVKHTQNSDTNSKVKPIASRCRELSKKIMDATFFKGVSEDSVRTLEKSLDEAYKTFLSQIPSSSNLYLEAPTPRKRKQSPDKTSESFSKLADLPKRSKLSLKKKYVGRVGAKATFYRKASTFTIEDKKVEPKSVRFTIEGDISTTDPTIVMADIERKKMNWAIENTDAIWEEKDDMKFEPIVLFGYKVYANDILLLKPNNWLTDEVIDCYLEVLRQKQASTVFHIPSQSLAKISTNNFKPNEHIHKKVALPQEEKLIIMDPLGERKIIQHSILNNWKIFFNRRAFDGLETSLVNWSLQSITHNRQRDSFNCGVFAILFAEKFLIEKERRQISVTEQELLETRRKVAITILSSAACTQLQ